MAIDIPNPRNLKLGRNKPRFQHRMKLSSYVEAAHPPVPLFVQNSKVVPSWGMFANDGAGDCVLAMMLHAIRLWWVASGKGDFAPTDSDILKLYFSLTGGGDDGLNPNTVLTYFQKVGIFTHTIDAYADIAGFDDMQLAIADLGCAGVGLMLPDTVVPQGEDWLTIPWTDLSAPPNPDNGHEVLAVDYDANAGMLAVVSWGGIIPVSADFIDKYADQKSAMVSRDYINALTGTTPRGIDLAAMLADVPLVSS